MNSDFPTRVEQIVTDARKLLGGSKDEARGVLARSLDMSPRQLYKWSAGVAQPKHAGDSLKKLTAALDELHLRGVHEQERGGSALVQQITELKRLVSELETRVKLLEGGPVVASHKSHPKEFYFIRRVKSLEEL